MKHKQRILSLKALKRDLQGQPPGFWRDVALLLVRQLIWETRQGLNRPRKALAPVAPEPHNIFAP